MITGHGTSSQTVPRRIKENNTMLMRGTSIDQVKFGCSENFRCDPRAGPWIINEARNEKYLKLL